MQAYSLHIAKLDNYDFYVTSLNILKNYLKKRFQYCTVSAVSANCKMYSLVFPRAALSLHCFLVSLVTKYIFNYSLKTRVTMQMIALNIPFLELSLR